MEIRNVPVGEIRIGFTHRRDLGDLKALAESIRKEGLLQPIGVTPDFQLVFGLRRFFACKGILHWAEIPCRIVDVSSILTGQYVENEMRKDFTPSERDSIRRALEIEAGTRQGQRTDLMAAASPGQELVVGSPHVAEGKKESAEEEGANGQCASVVSSGAIQARPGEKTRDLTARLADFGSIMEARRVGKIMEQGAPELIQAVDEKKVGISVGARLADLPKSEQVKVLAAGRDAIRAVLGFPTRRPGSATDSKDHREAAPLSEDVGTSTACAVEDAPVRARGQESAQGTAGDDEHCKCGGQWLADGDGGRFCEKCKASHPMNAKPYPDEGTEASRAEAQLEVYPSASLKEKVAALHKMEQDLGRPLRQLDYLAQILGKDDHYRSINRAIRIAFRHVDAWRQTVLPEEYWD